MASSVATGSKLGRYEIIKHLTSGGMADLLLARAGGLEGFERHVVIKRIRVEREDDQGFIEMFLHEARLAGSLHHHNIVQVYDIGEENGKPYFAMEYVHGEDLRTVLRRLYERKEQLPLQHLVTIMSAVATALHHAHEQKGPDRKSLGIVHRDVTPANILVGYDGNVKVVDFGIARAAARMTETQTGMLAGKAPYMAPEQCMGGVIDRRSDVFSLGAVLFELATVKRLFKGDNEFVTMTSIVKGTIPKPSSFRADLPPALDEIILRALARDPAARYQSAEQLHGALETVGLELGLRTSSTALAVYMKQLFGERPEPWVGDYQAPPNVDFEGLGSGVVVAPSDAEANAIPRTVNLTRSSPIARALSTLSTAATPVSAAGSQPVSAAAQPAVAIPRVKTPVPAPLPSRTKPKTVQIPVAKPVEVEDEDELAATAVVAVGEVDQLIDAAEKPVPVPAKPAPAKPAPAKPAPVQPARDLADESITASVTDVDPLELASLDLPVAPPQAKGLPSWSTMSKKPEVPTVSGHSQPRLDEPTVAPAKVAPGNVAPVKVAPGNAAPAKAALAKVELVKAPVKAPVKAEPVKAAPVSLEKPAAATLEPVAATLEPVVKTEPAPVKGMSAQRATVTPATAAAPKPSTVQPPSRPANPATLPHDTTIGLGVGVLDDGETLAQEQTELVESLADVAPAPPVTAAPPPTRITDPTEIVKPLPAPTATDRIGATPVLLAEGTQVTQPVRTVRDHKTLFLVAGVGAALVGVVVALVIGMSGGDATDAPSPAAPPTVAANNLAPPSEESPREPRTWANSEKPPGTEPPAKPALAESPSAAPVLAEPPPAAEPPAIEMDPPESVKPVEPAPTVASEEPTPAKSPATTSAPTKIAPVTKAKPTPKKVVKPTPKKKPVKKVAAKPVTKKPSKPKPTPATKPGWDPNSLFPKK